MIMRYAGKENRRQRGSQNVRERQGSVRRRRVSERSQRKERDLLSTKPGENGRRVERLVNSGEMVEHLYGKKRPIYGTMQTGDLHG